MRNYLLLILSVLMLAGCAAQKPVGIQIEIPQEKIDYLAQVKPILDGRCVVCHSCYNSPCQLKLSSFEGLDRGATKEEIYNASRLQTMDPTRLFVDAHSTEEWREKGFSSVSENSAEEGLNNSLMLFLLDHKMKNPKSKGSYRPEADDLTCASNHQELDSYLKKHPNKGMPYGFPPLTDEEFRTIAGWLGQGAAGPTADEQKKLTSTAPFDIMEVDKWETFLNTKDPKYQMTSRYLYEHLFLAHIKFPTSSGAFYEIVRSTTPSPQPVNIISTVRPYDDPGVDEFYYRFRRIHSTIVHKTHMVFEVDDEMMARIKQLFIEPRWLEEPHLVGYDEQLSANPFKSFAQIPPRSRYQWLLDNSRYIIMNFIRGPVCKGQVALNVIHDHFWIMFMDPEYDLSTKYPGFLKHYADLLAMPHEQGGNYNLVEAALNSYYKKAGQFRKEREKLYSIHYHEGLGYDAVWRGRKKDDAPVLTVYRHFDSASVHKGVVGALPRTLWVIDYPVFERIYYSLVAGFDVYGAVGHQLATRLYMDALRVDSESNFLEFMPLEQRKAMMESWYLNALYFGRIDYPTPEIATGIDFHTDEPKREFIETLVRYHFLRKTNIAFDKVNYLYRDQQYPPIPRQYETIDDYLQAFQAVSQPGVSFFTQVDDHEANIAYVRIRNPKGEDVVVSVVINRWHDNVAFMYGEELKLDPKKDNADFIEGFIGSYPNYFLDVHVDDLPEFFEMLKNYDGSMAYRKKLARFGVNRSDPKFWEIYDWFQAKFNRDEPVQAGLFDLNRYYHMAN